MSTGYPSYPSYPWGYWPTGDVYSTDAPWEERHSLRGSYADPLVEMERRYDFTASIGVDWVLTVDLIDTMGTTDEADDVAPTNLDHVASRIWRTWGWNAEYSMTVSPIMSTENPLLWTGSLEVRLPAPLHATLGEGPWRYEVTAWLDEDPPLKIIAVWGEFSVRP